MMGYQQHYIRTLECRKGKVFLKDFLKNLLLRLIEFQFREYVSAFWPHQAGINIFEKPEELFYFSYMRKISILWNILIILS